MKALGKLVLDSRAHYYSDVNVTSYTYRVKIERRIRLLLVLQRKENRFSREIIESRKHRSTIVILKNRVRFLRKEWKQKKKRIESRDRADRTCLTKDFTAKSS